jgi:hypothetical protein
MDHSCKMKLGPECLIGVERRKAWSCQVCARIYKWAKDGEAVVTVQEIRDHNGLYVFPAAKPERSPNNLMQLRTEHLGHEELRQIVQNLVLAAPELWINDEKCSMQLQAKDSATGGDGLAAGK